MAHTIHQEEGSNYRFGPLELEETKLHIKEYLEKDGLNLIYPHMGGPYRLLARRMGD